MRDDHRRDDHRHIQRRSRSLVDTAVDIHSPKYPCALATSGTLIESLMHHRRLFDAGHKKEFHEVFFLFFQHNSVLLEN